MSYILFSCQGKRSTALNKLTDKKTKLYILVDAHSNNDYYIKYYGRNPDSEGEPDYQTVVNRWLDIDGKWFELSNNRTINIFHDGKISNNYIKDTEKIRYVYHDKDNCTHDMSVFEVVEAQKWIKGSKNYALDWKEVVAGGKTRYYQYDGDNKTLLIKIKLPIAYNHNGVEINLADNTSREYINPIAYACLLGALAEHGYEDVTFNGFTSEDGTGAPSVTHFNGIAGDLRYLRKDKEITSLHINTDPDELDITRQEQLIDDLRKFGWETFLSYKITVDGEDFLLKHSTHMSHHHLHINRAGFQPNYC